MFSEYDFIIIHRAGRSHGNADGLSRRLCPQCGMDYRDRAAEVYTGDDNQRGADTELKEGSTVRIVTIEPTVTHESWRQEQEGDQSLDWIIRSKTAATARPEWSEITSSSPSLKSYCLLWDQLEIRGGLLCKKWESDDSGRIRYQVVVPKPRREEVVRELYGGQTGGHLGQKKTLAKVCQRFYWSGMNADVRSFVRQCYTCASKKSPTKRRRAPLQQYVVGEPMQRTALDILGPLPETERGNKYVLVVGDYFSKWIEAYPVPDERAETVAQKLVMEYVCRFGVPVELHSDQGRNFKSQVFGEMCKVLGINTTRTTPYNQKCDGMIERFNRTLLSMVAVMIEPHKRQRDWDEKVALATFAYRATPHESTGETPNMLMLGREVFLPLDLMTRVASDMDEGDIQSDYAYQLREGMRFAHDRAREHLRNSTRRQKKYYDQKTSPMMLTTGQFVWLHNPSRKKGLSPKLQRRWEGPYLIQKKLSEVTFRIQLKPRGKKKVVHFDRLKPYEGRSLVPWDGTEPPGTSCQQQRQHEDPEIEEGEDMEVIEETLGERVGSETCLEPSESVQKTPEVQEENQRETPQRVVGRRNPPRHRCRPQRYL